MQVQVLWCTGVYKEKQWVIRENLGTQFNQRVNGVLNFPDFPLGASSVRRRVHDNGIVFVSSADFPLYKFYAVIHQPANRCVLQSEDTAFSFAQETMPLEASTWVTAAPAAAAARVVASGVGKEI